MYCTFPSAITRAHAFALSLARSLISLTKKNLSTLNDNQIKSHSLPGSFNHFGTFTVPVADANEDDAFGLDEEPGVVAADAVLDSGSGGMGKSSACSSTERSSGADTVTSGMMRRPSGSASDGRMAFARAYDSWILPRI